MQHNAQARTLDLTQRESSLLKVYPEKIHAIEGQYFPEGERDASGALDLLAASGVRLTRRGLQWYATRGLLPLPRRRRTGVVYSSRDLEAVFWAKVLQTYYGLRIRDLRRLRELGTAFRSVAVGAYIIERKLDRYRAYLADRESGPGRARRPVEEAVFPIESLRGIFPAILGAKRLILNEYFRLVLAGADPEAIDLRREALLLDPVAILRRAGRKAPGEPAPAV
jgi:DNA-binding transcriptional MerR regulator